MIFLRRLGGPVFALNPDLIERAESTPDTVVTMVGGNKYVVCEDLAELTDLIIEHRAQIIAAAETMSSDAAYNRHLASTGTHATNAYAVNNSVVPLRPRDA